VANGERSAQSAQHRRFSYGSENEKDSCDNCEFVVPRDVSKSNDVPGSPRKGGKQHENSPILRTTQNIMASGSVSSFDEEDDDEDEDEDDQGLSMHHSLPRRRSGLSTSPVSSQNSAMGRSSSYASPSIHAHNLTYVTRRNPESQSIYARLRRSCIRALSCESLPRGCSSGPMLFGDPIAGYTIAYLFRVPDPLARGGRRMYALQALGADCWRATAAFTQVTKAFETIANKIITMADQILDRKSTILTSHPSTGDILRSTPPLSTSLPSESTPLNGPRSPQLGQHQNVKSSANSPVGNQKNLDVSSFFVAKGVDPDGHKRVARKVPRARGLAEIVERDNFFIELHAQFCVILYNLASGLQ